MKNQYFEETTKVEKFNRFRVYIKGSEEILTFKKAKSLSEVMNLLSKKVIGVIGIK